MNIWRMIRVSLSVSACLALAGMASCIDGEDPNPPAKPVAFVSLYHGSPNAPSMDVRVDGSKINPEALHYGDYTGYLNFDPGSRHLRFNPVGADNVIVIDSTVTFEDQHVYSTFVIDEGEHSELLIVNDDPSSPSPGMAKIRFINLSPDAGMVSLKVDGETNPLISGKLFKEASDFIQVDASKYDFIINSEGGGDIVLLLTDTSLKAGWFYTVIVHGYDTPPVENPQSLKADIVVN